MAYNGVVGYIARSNEKIEPAYSEVPESPFVSGGPRSHSPFNELGLQGRRYVTDVVRPALIEDVLGEPAVAHPIHTYVGFNSVPLYSTGRAELALAELERTGAFDRSYLLLVSPTGTGWVDQTVVEVAGHTDSTGSDAYNQGLSERRAASVANYLRGRGIMMDRLITVGMGESRPIADNSTTAGRQANRRVEITMVPVTAG
mgnify:CR=1 FL=1